MIISSKFRIILIMTAVIVLHLTSYAHAEDYKWLKSPEYKSILVLTDFNGCDFIANELNETVKGAFSRSNIRATLSNSLVFNETDNSNSSVYDLLDEKLVNNNKVLLHIYGKCIRYSSGFIYQFDLNFGVADQKNSQALLYSTPLHSVVGVDSVPGIERTFRMLMKNAVDDYLSANQ